MPVREMGLLGQPRLLPGRTVIEPLGNALFGSLCVTHFPVCVWICLNTFHIVVFAGQMCVHLAAIGGHVDVLRHLVWFGANINARVSISAIFV
jgi:hypothetical protein